MPQEQNNGLTFRQDNVLLIFKDGDLAALELQNGVLKRYIVKEADRSDSLALFGADKPAVNTAHVAASIV